MLSQNYFYLAVEFQFDLTALQIADLYRQRWQIELFFNWIKQNLKIKAFFGTSRNAVLIQIWTALIAYILLIWLKLKSIADFDILELSRLVRTLLMERCSLWEILCPKHPPSPKTGRYPFSISVPDTNVDGYDLNNRGDVVGKFNYENGLSTGALWPGGGGPIDLGSLLTESVAYAINEQGMIVGSSFDYSDPNWPMLATLWVKEGDTFKMYGLNKLVVGLPENVYLLGATDINENGWIIGWSYGSAYLLRPVPLPGSILLMGYGLLRLGLLGWSRRKGL